MNRNEAAAILGVGTDASESEARKAYLARARLLHPDRFAGAPAVDIAAATAAMAQLNAAMDEFRGTASSGGFNDEPPSPPPPPSGSSSDPHAGDGAGGWSDPSTACQICGWGPATEAKFNTVTGLILLWRWGTLEGRFCRYCGEAAYNEAQGSTLLKGWWGVIAPLATVVAFLGNLSRIGTIRRQGEPVGRANTYTPLTTPMHFSKAWFKRPASVIATVVAFAIIGFIIAVAVAPSSGMSSSNGGNTSSGLANAPVGSCWTLNSDESYSQLDCSYPSADVVVTASVTSADQCPVSFFSEDDGTFSCFEPIGSAPAAAPQASPSTPVEVASISGIPVSEMTACISGEDVERACEQGKKWLYSYCWSLDDSAVALQKYEDGTWRTVETGVATDNNCDGSTYPYIVEFGIDETGLGSTKYRVKAMDGSVSPHYFTATVTAPGKYFETCVTDWNDDETCKSGLEWTHESCWVYARSATLQYQSSGSWKTLSKGTVTKDAEACESGYPYVVTVGHTQKYPGTFKYRMYIPASADYLSTTKPVTVRVRIAP